MIRSLIDDEIALIGALRMLGANVVFYAFNYDGSPTAGSGYTTQVPPNPSNLAVYSGVPGGFDRDSNYINFDTTWQNGWWAFGGKSYIQGGFIDQTIPYADGYELPVWGAAWDSGQQCFVPTFAMRSFDRIGRTYRGGVLAFVADGATLYLLSGFGVVSTWNGGAPFTDTTVGLPGGATFYSTAGVHTPGPGPFPLENNFSGQGPGWVGQLTGLFRHNGEWWGIGSGKWYNSNDAIMGDAVPAHALLRCTGDPIDWTAWTLCEDVVSPLNITFPTGFGLPVGWIGPMSPSGAWTIETGTYIVANYVSPTFDNRTHIYLLATGATTLTVSRSFLVDEDMGGSIVDLGGELYTTTHVAGTHHVRLYQLVAGVWALISTAAPGPDPLRPTHWVSDTCVGRPMYATHGYIHMPGGDSFNNALVWNSAGNTWTAWYRDDPIWGFAYNDGLGRIWPNDPGAP